SRGATSACYERSSNERGSARLVARRGPRTARSRHGLRGVPHAVRSPGAGSRARARHAVRERDAPHPDHRHPHGGGRVLRGGARHRAARLRRDGRAREVPPARAGDRMGAAVLPAGAAWLGAALLLIGAGLTFVGSLGLLRLRSFYDRVHSPTLGTTLGTGGILIGSMVYFSVLGTRP